MAEQVPNHALGTPREEARGGSLGWPATEGVRPVGSAESRRQGLGWPELGDGLTPQEEDS